MNRLTAGASQGLALIKMPAKVEKMPALLKNMFMGQLAFFGFYSLISGPSQMKMKRNFTVSPESGMQSLFTFNFCHTSPVSLAVNLGVLSTLGAYHYRTVGAHSFMRLFGLGCIAASIAVAVDARSNPKQVQAGSAGGSAALLTYTSFANPAYFSMWKMSPLMITALTLGYGVYFDDKAVVGGIAGGYAAFLLAF